MTEGRKGAKYCRVDLKATFRFEMATNKANGPTFCQAARLPQSVADRASAPLADGRQNKV